MKKPLPKFIRFLLYSRQIDKNLQKLLIVIFLFCISASVSAQSIKGKVFDVKTGEPLTGATIQAQSGDLIKYTSANLDGSFVFHNLKPGSYKVKARFVSYATTKEYDVVVAPNAVSTVIIYMTDASTAISEVQVNGARSKENDQSVRGLEKNAVTVENILSANAIQLLPDVTVGNALQRISGVTVQRTSSGEGRYAIIRGMDQRYNNTLVNGIKIPSPDDKYRFVPMDIFPSEMLERLEVIKALTPTMEGDAIGGTMNLVMKTAPDRFVLSANFSLGYSTLFSDRPFSAFDHSGINQKSPAEINGNNYVANYSDFTKSNLNYHNLSSPVNSTFGLTVGDRFFNNKLGVIVSASYQNFYNGSNEEFLEPSAQPYATPTPNTPNLSDIYSRQYSTQTTRYGVHNRIDYVIDSKNKISLYNLFLHQDEYQTRYTADTTLGINSYSNLKEVEAEYRSTWTKQNVYNGTLQGNHILSDNFKLNWKGVYSIATKAVPDQAYYTIEEAVNEDNSGRITSVDSIAKSMTRIWQHNRDQDLAGYLDLIYKKKILSRDVEFSLGGLYRHKTRSNYYNEYDLVPAPQGQIQTFHTIDQANFGFATPGLAVGSYTAATANTYTVTENTADEYLQVKFMLLDKLQVLGGVRIESTDQDYNTQAPVTTPARYGQISYTDVLPSVHLKYALTDKQNLRLAYYGAVSRPGFGEIVPYNLPGDYYNEIGNPYLKHTTADNFDFRYELFPGGADQLLVGAFYKDLHNPIEFFVVRDATPGGQNIQPQNVNTATNYGAELLFTKYLGFFGFSVNYTYTNSSVTTAKLNYYLDPAKGYQQNTIDQTRPLQGQAENTGNASLLFKDVNIGLDMQIAYVYTGERIAQVSPYYNLDFWQRPYGQLAFSFEKTLGKHLSFYGKLNNLTNATNQEFLKHPAAGIPTTLPDQSGKDLLIEKDIYKFSFLAGLRYKF